ncbi:MAG: aminotransferase class IV [Adhaeribacter sp.]
MLLKYNFQTIQEEAFKLHYLNRGFQYNDGLFDTLIFTQGRIRFLHDHLDRLRKALKVLGLGLPEEWLVDSFWHHQVAYLIRENGLVDPAVRIKVNVWRQPGGLFTPESERADILLTVSPQPALPAVISRAGFLATAPVPHTPFSFFKGPYALHYVQASREKKRLGLGEGILCDAQGNISEALVSNIFWLKESTLWTPALASGCIAGIMRLNVLRASQMLRLEVQEGLFPPASLLEADLVFTSNVTGLRPIAMVGDRSFQTDTPVFRQLQQMVLSHLH